MNLHLEHNFIDNVLSVERSTVEGSVQYIFKFDNNYGASIIKRPGSFGYRQDLWKLAVIYFEDDEYYLTYDTEITDDVIGHLTDEEVNTYLDRIRNL